MASRSQELAPKRRTLAGKPLSTLEGDGSTLAAGTQTMCMSECTSMPAALRLRTVRTGACSRGGREARDLALAELPERLRWLMVSTTLGQWGKNNQRGPRGAEGMQFPQRDRRSAWAAARRQ